MCFSWLLAYLRINWKHLRANHIFKICEFIFSYVFFKAPFKNTSFQVSLTGDGKKVFMLLPKENYRDLSL